MKAFTTCSKGTLEVAHTLAAIPSRFYGDNVSTTCIIDGDVSIHLSCAARIIENLDIEHFAGHLLTDLVYNHHKVYGCSCKTLLSLVSLLSVSASYLRDQGLDDESILKGLRDAVELCIASFKCLSLKDFFEESEKTANTNGEFTELPTPVSPKIHSKDCDEEFEEKQLIVLNDTSRGSTTDKSTSDVVDESDDCDWFFDNNGNATETDIELSLISSLAKLQDAFSSEQLSLPVERLVSSIAKTGVKDQSKEPELSHSSFCKPEGGLGAGLGAGLGVTKPVTLGHKKVVSSSPPDEVDEFDECFVGIKCGDREHKSSVEKEKTKEISVHKFETDFSELCQKFRCEISESSEHMSSLGSISPLLSSSSNDATGETFAMKHSEKASDIKVSNPEELGPLFKSKDRGSMGEKMRGDAGSGNLVTSTLHRSDTQPQSTGSDAGSDVTPSDPSSPQSLMLKLQGIMDSKPKLGASKLYRNSRYFRNVNDSDTAAGQSVREESTAMSSPEIPAMSNNCLRQSNQPIVTYEKLKSLVRKLSHGCPDLADLVTPIIWGQNNLINDKCLPTGIKSLRLDELRFSVGGVHSVGVGGVPSSCSCSTPGFITTAPVDVLQLVTSGSPSRQALLIKGDIELSFRHKGINKKLEKEVVSKTLPSMSRQSKWFQSVTSIIDELCVDAIVCKGTVSGDVLDWCLVHNIVVVQNVASKVLTGIAEAHMAPIATYITQCTQDYVVKDVTLEIWRSQWRDQVAHQSAAGYLKISSPCTTTLQTLVVCHPCVDQAGVVEEQCKHLLHRLHHVLTGGRYMQGCPETYLAYTLHTEADFICDNRRQDERECEVTAYIYRAIADRFTSLQHLAYCNITGTSSAYTTVNRIETVGDGLGESFDDCVSKAEAYRSAYYFVRRLLLTDVEIITGIDKHETMYMEPGVVGCL